MEQIKGDVEIPTHSWLSRNLNILDQLPPFLAYQQAHGFAEGRKSGKGWMGLIVQLLHHELNVRDLVSILFLHFTSCMTLGKSLASVSLTIKEDWEYLPCLCQEYTMSTHALLLGGSFLPFRKRDHVCFHSWGIPTDYTSKPPLCFFWSGSAFSGSILWICMYLISFTSLWLL